MLLEFRAPFVGVNKEKDPRLLSPQEAEDCLNIDLDDGTLRKRFGIFKLHDFANDPPVLGIHTYRKADGTVLTIAKAQEILYRVEGAVSTPIFTGMTLDEPADFETVNNRVYVVDGGGFRVTDGFDSFPAQLPRPSFDVAIVGTNPGGKLRGKFDYKFTYYSSTWGQESPASDVSDLVTSTQGEVRDVSITIAIVTSSAELADSRIDKVRLYRRNVATYEPTWSLVKEFGLTDPGVNSNFDDNLPDIDRDFTKIAPPSEAFDDSGFRFLAFQAGVLFMAGKSNQPTLLYFTRPDQPFVIKNFLEVGSGNDSDPITGLKAVQGAVWIFKRNSVWLLSGNSEDSFFLRKIFVGVGCRGHFSIVEWQGLVLWLAEDGFYATDGSSDPKKISLPLEPEILKRRDDYDRFCVGHEDHERGMILWSLTLFGHAKNSDSYAYFYRNSTRVQAPSWSPWRLSAPMYSSGQLFSQLRGDRRVMGLTDGSISAQEDEAGNDDDGFKYDVFWRTGRINADAPNRYKKWGEFAANIRSSQEVFTSAIDVNYYLDDATTPTTIEGVDIQDETIRNRIARSSRDLRLEFRQTQLPWPWTVHQFELEAEVKGRA